MINDDIIEYIKNEKEISKYNIYILERKEITPSTKRLIAIENEFIELPLESLDFKTVDDASNAILLYKKSRKNFFSKYPFLEGNNVKEKINKKISYLNSVKEALLNKDIESMNVVQNEFYFNELTKYLASKNNTSFEEQNNITKNLPIKELVKMEPAILAKKRAEIQVLFFSLGILIDDFLKTFIISDDNLFGQNVKIDNFISNLEDNIFKNYNVAIDNIRNVYSLTMGQNNYFNRLHKLTNIIDSYGSADAHACVYLSFNKDEVSFESPKIHNVYFGIKKIIINNIKSDSNIKTKNKTFAILFPFNRLSYEKMTLLYKEIYYKKINISNLFSDTIANMAVENAFGDKEYYKGIFLKPLWEMVELSEMNNEYENFIIDLFDHKYEIKDLKNDTNIDDINKKYISPIDLDLSSKIYIPKTRSDEYRIDLNFNFVQNKINDIKNQYQNIV